MRERECVGGRESCVLWRYSYKVSEIGACEGKACRTVKTHDKLQNRIPVSETGDCALHEQGVYVTS